MGATTSRVLEPAASIEKALQGFGLSGSHPGLLPLFIKDRWVVFDAGRSLFVGLVGRGSWPSAPRIASIAMVAFYVFLESS